MNAYFLSRKLPFQQADEDSVCTMPLWHMRGTQISHCAIVCSQSTFLYNIRKWLVTDKKVEQTQNAPYSTSGCTAQQ